MRILHVISGIDAASGGTASALWGLAAGQAQAGLEVSVASSFRGAPPDGEVQQLRARGVQVHLIGPVYGKLMRCRGLASSLRPLVQACRVVHTHALWEEIQHRAAVLARRYGKPYVMSPHGMLDPWSLRQNALVKKLYLAWRLKADLNRAAAIQFTSATERNLTAPLKLRAPALVVPNGIALHEFADLPPAGFLRRRFPQIGDRPIVLFLSRIHPKKGLDLLIPAFAQVPPAAGVLVITGPDADGYQVQVEDMVRAHGLTDRVVFTGPLYGTERIAAYVDARLFVLPSYQENFGIVVIEALAAGVPVLISDQVNICDDIVHNGVGGVVKCQVDELGAGLQRWLGDEELHRAAARKARPFALSTYDWASIARTSVEAYTRIAQGNRVDPPLENPPGFSAGPEGPAGPGQSGASA
jgi:glycosyltransferase involved in cell wall biosynthesis